VFVSDVTNAGPIPVLEKTLAFTEARHRVLTENIANVMTPGYHAKQLNVATFQAALKEAAQKRTSDHDDIDLPSSDQFHTDAMGMLQVTPGEVPPENLLFQDGTNVRIERQMASLAENTMMNQVVSNLIRAEFDRLDSAIRGRMR
jgi:flagellar basal-body rod protein FlgB